ncbi:lysosome membrane protein 2-like [Pectinophora gossypiella]|uniref:lysosome membrane protein 2-like n=1 Tax=Pectinophora gossypiella TaxID=13191 RepID=UPI00214E8DCF|nr:lysosome membrane protein 2-like [Pectinophora gossypiella]XP_049870526.1 lysosome membrane protein 2-like [Pectinophora gossypiella]
MGIITNRRVNPLIASRKKILALATLGMICLMMPVIMKIVDPVQVIARYRTRVAIDSPVHELLKQELEAVHMSAYLFNVTNAERFMSGEDQKLKVEEVGPFTYRELRSNEDLEIDTDEGVVRYSPKITPVFSPEESIADPHNVTVALPNIALLTMVSMMSEYPFLSRMGFNMLTMQLGTKALVTMSAHDYLWGYNESLITVGNTFMPGWISFDTMGLMDRLYDKNVPYRLEVGATNADKFQIKTLNKLGGLRMWGYEDPSLRTKCNSFENAYEGIGYPTDLSPSTPVRIFRNVLCRMLELDFHHTMTMEYGAQALVYKISNRTFANGCDKNCTCMKGICIEGLSDISPCFYNLPLAVSNAHFLYGGPELFERIEGLQPDEEKHGSEFFIEPKVGAVLKTSFSIQVNIVLGDVRYNEQARRFADMALPVGYFKIVQPDLPELNKAEMRMLYITGPYIALGLQVAFSLVGVILLVFAMRLLYWNWICSEGRGIAFQIPDEGKKVPILSVESPLMRTESYLG